MDKAYKNNNREVWRQDMHDPMDLSNYYAPSVFVVGDSSIGIDAGGTVHVRDVREWAKMPDEIARLTADLAEARADVQRFEAQLDAARAEAKRLQDLIERRRIADTDRVCYVCERPMRSDQAVTDQDIDNICPACASETIGTLNHASRTLRAGAEQADARYRAELAQARAERDAAERERDEALKRRDFAKDGEDNMRFLKVLWQNECHFYRAQSIARLHEIDMSRRTIRALVVAFRDALHLTRRVASDETWDMWLQLVQRQTAERRQTERGQQAGE